MTYYTVDRRVILFFACFGTILPALAQRITNIRPVAYQDTIVLTYDLVGAQPGQQFKIKAYCHNGYGDIIELKALEEARRGGTVVAGGTHQLTWRVLTDVPNGLDSDSIMFTLIATLPEGPSLDLADRKALLYRELTAKTNVYLEQLYDQKVWLEYFSAKPFQSNWVYGELARQRDTFNKTYLALLEKHQDFELTVETLWDNDAREATEKFFNAILRSRTSTHQNLLDSYNKILNKMNTYVHGPAPGRKALAEEIQRDIRNVTTDPDGERQDLRAAAEDLYKKLK